MKAVDTQAISWSQLSHGCVAFESPHMTQWETLQSISRHMCQDPRHSLDSQRLRGQIRKYLAKQICQDLKLGNNSLGYFYAKFTIGNAEM